MSFDLIQVIEDGVDRSITRAAGILVGVFVALQLVQTAVQQSLFYQVIVEVVDIEEFLAEEGDLAEVEAELGMPVEEFVAEQFPFAILELPAGALLALLLLGSLVGLVFKIGAWRLFVSDHTESVPTSLFTRRLGWTLLNLIAGTILYYVIVILGFILIVPGIFFAVALFFYNYEIVVEDKNAIDGLKGSWELTEGHRIELFALGAIVVVLSGIVSSMAGFFAPSTSVIGVSITTIVNAALAIFGIAVAAQAYNQLRGAGDGLPTAEDGPAGGPAGTTPGGPGAGGADYGQGQPPQGGPGDQQREDEADEWGTPSGDSDDREY